MATCAHNPAHVSKPKQKAPWDSYKGEWANSPCSFLTKKKKKKATRDSYKGTKPLKNGLRVVPSVFCHPLLDMNSAQGLSY